MLFEEDRQQIIACLASLLELEDNDSEVSDLLDYLLTLSSQEALVDYFSQLFQSEKNESLASDIVDFKKGKKLQSNADISTKVSIGNKVSTLTIKNELKEKKKRERLNQEKEKREEKRRQEKIIEESARMEKKKSELKESKRKERQNQEKEKREEERCRENKIKKSEKELNESIKKTKIKELDKLDNLSVDSYNENLNLPQNLRGKSEKSCGCFGTIHKPLTNCLHCGRIACSYEIDNLHCVYCGFVIETINAVSQTSIIANDKALLHKERLLKFDREFTRRTVIYDDQADYFRNSTSTWLTEEEKTVAKKDDTSQRKKLHERKKQTLTIS